MKMKKKKSENPLKAKSFERERGVQGLSEGLWGLYRMRETEQLGQNLRRDLDR